VFVAFGAYFVLPNFPRTTSWLTDEERMLAVWRLEEDIGQDDWVNSEQQTFWQGAKLAFADIKTYVLVSTAATCAWLLLLLLVHSPSTIHALFIARR
jgi:hypothetical protein